MKESVEKDKKFNMYFITFQNSQKQKKRNVEITNKNIDFQSTAFELLKNI